MLRENQIGRNLGSDLSEGWVSTRCFRCFRGNQHNDLTWFVAIDGHEFYKVFGGQSTYVRECENAGDFVDVDAFYVGPSLLDP